MSHITKMDVLNKVKCKISQITDFHERSTLSVYVQGANKKRKPVHFGTAFLLEFKKVKYIATARHLTQQLVDGDELYFLSKLGAFFSLSSVRSKDGFEVVDDDIDYHVIKIEKNLLDILAIPCDDDVVPTPYDLTLSIGYPNSKNKTRVDSENRKAAMTSLRLTLTGLPLNEAQPLPDYPHHFALPWQDQLDENWQGVDSIGIKGMSGAPCFYVPFSAEDLSQVIDPYKGVKLIGLLIEKNKDFVKFIRIDRILKHLSR